MDALQKRKLFIVYNRAMWKAKKSSDALKLRQRIQLALGILQHREYYIEEKALYHPTYFTCSCKDWEYKNATKRDYRGACKHMIAEILRERIAKISYQQMSFA